MPAIPPKKPVSWGSVSKGLSFWILVILIPVAIIQLSGSGRDAPVAIQYWQYRAQLEKDKAQMPTIQGGKQVTG